MQIEFDAEKDASNRAKHGCSLADAAQLDWTRMVAFPDTREDYGEPREIGYAPWGKRVYCLVFTRRASAVRPISLRRANRREVTRYEKAKV